MITRYWGEPPASLGLRITGHDRGIYSYSDCGDGTRPTGQVAYWYTDERSVDHDLWSWSSVTPEGTGETLTAAQEAMLTERFGPPVVLPIDPSDRVAAVVALWRWHALALMLFAMPLVLARFWRPRLVLSGDTDRIAIRSSRGPDGDVRQRTDGSR